MRKVFVQNCYLNLFKNGKEKKKIEILNERVESIITDKMMIKLENHLKIHSKKDYRFSWIYDSKII